MIHFSILFRQTFYVRTNAEPTNCADDEIVKYIIIYLKILFWNSKSQLRVLILYENSLRFGIDQLRKALNLFVIDCDSSDFNCCYIIYGTINICLLFSRSFTVARTCGKWLISAPINEILIPTSNQRTYTTWQSPFTCYRDSFGP